MSEVASDDDRLMAAFAAKHDVPVEIVKALLDLERTFPDMGVWGAKTGLENSVAAIVAAASREGGPG